MTVYKSYLNYYEKIHIKSEQKASHFSLFYTHYLSKTNCTVADFQQCFYIWNIVLRFLSDEDTQRIVIVFGCSRLHVFYDVVLFLLFLGIFLFSIISNNLDLPSYF